ncbi:hypothetical protein TRIUR3_27719 [Triticum urartu]|uniref:Uncharacterized protein n=1 Tax=Triticum urartu TaxID=4572 RepID=M7YD79_TRIUA|nr:hypothetical protein TRIUR3_27719 [Triticum urartu]
MDARRSSPHHRIEWICASSTSVSPRLRQDPTSRDESDLLPFPYFGSGAPHLLPCACGLPFVAVATASSIATTWYYSSSRPTLQLPGTGSASSRPPDLPVYHPRPHRSPVTRPHQVPTSAWPCSSAREPAARPARTRVDRIASASSLMPTRTEGVASVAALPSSSRHRSLPAPATSSSTRPLDSTSSCSSGDDEHPFCLER